LKNFKIATYNVNSIRSRLHIILPWLKENRPDVFCMQETKVEDGKFPVGEFEDTGYGVIFKGAKRYNGVAIASLEKPEMVNSGLDDGNPPDKDRLIRCVFSGIHIINTYVPQGRERESPHFAYKLEWFRRLRDFWTNCIHRRAVNLCGDLNVAPEAIDVHDPKDFWAMSVSRRRCGRLSIT